MDGSVLRPSLGVERFWGKKLNKSEAPRAVIV